MNTNDPDIRISDKSFKRIFINKLKTSWSEDLENFKTKCKFKNI